MKESKRVCESKVTYHTKGHFKKAIKKHLEKYGQQMRAYKCKHSGFRPHFHLTSDLSTQHPFPTNKP